MQAVILLLYLWPDRSQHLELHLTTNKANTIENLLSKPSINMKRILRALQMTIYRLRGHIVQIKCKLVVE